MRLPEDQKCVEQLKLKLEEYKKRAALHRNEVGRDKANMAYTAPEIVLDYDTSCKIEVLSELLKSGHASLDELRSKYSLDDPRVPYLQNAFEVIEDYVKTGGVNVDPRTGTGLPEVENK